MYLEKHPFSLATSALPITGVDLYKKFERICVVGTWVRAEIYESIPNLLIYYASIQHPKYPLNVDE